LAICCQCNLTAVDTRCRGFWNVVACAVVTILVWVAFRHRRCCSRKRTREDNNTFCQSWQAIVCVTLKNKLTGRTFAGGTDNQRVVALHARGGFFIAVARAVVTVLPIVAGA